MNQRKSLFTGALLGLLAITLGAFGAHALKNILLSNGSLETYELAVRYQFYHAFALILIGILQQFINSKWLRISSLLLLIGTIFFSGSLYVLTFSATKSVVFITPIGGALLMAGWLSLMLGIIKGKK